MKITLMVKKYCSPTTNLLKWNLLTKLLFLKNVSEFSKEIKYKKKMNWHVLLRLLGDSGI